MAGSDTIKHCWHKLKKKNFSTHENLTHNMLRSKRKQILSDHRVSQRKAQRTGAKVNAINRKVTHKVLLCAFVCILLQIVYLLNVISLYNAKMHL